jgi:hypothetical protein
MRPNVDKSSVDKDRGEQRLMVQVDCWVLFLKIANGNKDLF